MLNIKDGVDRKGLRELYNTNPDAKVILDHLASFERNRTETTVRRLRSNVRHEGNDLSRGAVIDVFRSLEKLECGRFIPGRRGGESRFKWSVGFVEVGQAAAGEAVKIEAAPVDVVSDPGDDLIEHHFRLRKDLDVPFQLPADLTLPEAGRLAAFIQTLPFNETALKT